MMHGPIYIKLYSVASCWIIIAILYDARSIGHKKNEKGVDRKDPLLFEVLSLHAPKSTGGNHGNG